MFSNFEIFPKSSASPSLFIKAKDINGYTRDSLLNTVGIDYSTQGYIYFFKIYFSKQNFNENSKYTGKEIEDNFIGDNGLFDMQDSIGALDYEKLVYEKLMLDIRNADGTYKDPPYIVPSIGKATTDFNNLCYALKCDDREKEIFKRMVYIFLKLPDYYSDIESIKEIYKQGQSMLTSSEESKKRTNNLVSKAIFEIIIIPNIQNSTSLHKIMKYINNNYNLTQHLKYCKTMCLLLKKVFIGIKCLLKNDITHNDLHASNILVQNQNQIYKTYIFDFDRAYIKGIDNKLLNDYCEDYTQCNKYDEWLDLLKILCYVVVSLPQNIVYKIFEIMSNSRINNTNFDKFKLLLGSNTFFYVLKPRVKIVVNNGTRFKIKGNSIKQSYYYDNTQPEYNTLKELKDLLISIEDVIHNLDLFAPDDDPSMKFKFSNRYNLDFLNFNDELINIV
jgi:hypothetical protein